MGEALRRMVARFRHWIRDDVSEPPDTHHEQGQPGPGHAPGHRHLGPPPEMPEPRGAAREAAHDQPWVPTGGLTDRHRRSERRG